MSIYVIIITKMVKDLDRKTRAILKIIGEAIEPIGSVEIAEKLLNEGFDLSERTVRYHLKKMNDEGLIQIRWKEGRMITSKGREELSDALVFDKVGMVSAHIDSMAYRMDFDIDTKEGSVILNLSFIKQGDFSEALKVMEEVFRNKLGTGDMVLVGQPGEKIGDITVPPDMVGFGTICSINLNGILLKHSIPVDSRFGGILQIEQNRPLRFTDIIHYSGSTMDPHEIFLRSRMTSVLKAVHGSGKVLAGMREIPAVSKAEAEAIIRRAERAGFGGAFFMGQPGQAVMGMPVGMERVGIVFPGGLNPVAAVEECGIYTESKALVALVEYSRLKRFSDW